MAPCAMQALHTLLQPGSLPARWHGVPVVRPGLPSTEDGTALGIAPHTDRTRADDVTTAPGTAPRIAVCLHPFYPELLPEIQSHLAGLPAGWRLLVTVPEFACTPQLREGLAHHPDTRVFALPNRGRGVWPWLQLLAAGVFDDCDWVCKLHSKKRPHTAPGQAWRQQIMHSLAGPEDNVRALLQALAADPGVSLVGPAQYLKNVGDPHWGHRSDNTGMWLARHLQLPPLPGGASEWPYFAGTMFRFRPAALRPLARAGLQAADFAPEMGQLDGTRAHAMERIVTRAVRAAGFATGQRDAGTRRMETVDWPSRTAPDGLTA